MASLARLVAPPALVTILILVPGGPPAILWGYLVDLP
jgi:hypothetical protein